MHAAALLHRLRVSLSNPRSGFIEALGPSLSWWAQKGGHARLSYSETKQQSDPSVLRC